MYASQIGLRNIRCFKDTTATLVHPGVPQPPGVLPNVTVLIAVNGGGKSTLLRALPLALFGAPLIRSRWQAHHLVRRTGPQARAQAEGRFSVSVHLDEVSAGLSGAYVAAQQVISGDASDDVLEAQFTWHNAGPSPLYAMFMTVGLPIFCAGYGATRRVAPVGEQPTGGPPDAMETRFQRVASLFVDDFPLRPLNAWLPALHKEQPEVFEDVRNCLNALLPQDAQVDRKPAGRELLFIQRGVPVPFSALSDGYRSYLGWVGDLLAHLVEATPSGGTVQDVKGVVLVDEVDLHIHPQWQRRMLRQLSGVLHNLQFVVTTHSPLVLGSVHAANVRLLRGTADGAVECHLLDRETHGLSADQLLVEEFDLDMPREPEFAARLRTQSRRAESGGFEEARKLIAMLAKGAAGERE